MIGLLGLSAVTVQTPNELVGSIKDTVKVVGEVDLAIDEVGGFDEFLKRANDWLERELAK